MLCSGFAKLLGKVVEEARKIRTLFRQKLENKLLRRKQFPEESVQKFFERLLRSLQICSCPYVAVAQSLRIHKEKRVTDLHRFLRKDQHWYPLLTLPV